MVSHRIICSDYGGGLARKVLNELTAKIGNDRQISIMESDFSRAIEVHIEGHDLIFDFHAKRDSMDDFVALVCTTIRVCHPR